METAFPPLRLEKNGPTVILTPGGDPPRNESGERMSLGNFYGIGLGPGDPGLVTLRAAEVLRSVQVIYAAASQQSSRSVSGRILDALSGLTARRCELAFTMSNNFEERLARIDEHAEQILAVLQSGQDAAFVTIGDPMTYSTCGYLLRALLRREPELPHEIIPGVNSWSALAAKEAVPLVEDQTMLQIVPAAIAPGSAELDRLLAADATTVLLKCYRTREELLRQLSERGFHAVYGAGIGLEEEFVSDDPDAIAARPREYLSMLIVRKAGAADCDPVEKP